MHGNIIEAGSFLVGVIYNDEMLDILALSKQPLWYSEYEFALLVMLSFELKTALVKISELFLRNYQIVLTIFDEVFYLQASIIVSNLIDKIFVIV